jgi:hypothetical protein
MADNIKIELEIPYCEAPCNGPIFGRSRSHLFISHVAYWVWVRLPASMIYRRIGLAILNRAGHIAFACHCPDKNAAVKHARPKFKRIS